MIPNSVFQSTVELPSLTDTAYIAMVEGRTNAVEALARAMKRQKLVQKVGPFTQYIRFTGEE